MSSESTDVTTGVRDQHLAQRAASVSSSLVAGRAFQPMGSRDAVTARVPGFEDIVDQPDWGDHGFSGRKSDMRLIRFDRSSIE